jgi:membrane protein
MIQENLERFIELRKTVGLIGVIGIMWSASGSFTILTYNINSAWEKARLRSGLQRRLIALGLVFGLVACLILLLLVTTVTDLLAEAEVPLLGRLSLSDSPLWQILSVAILPLITFLVFFVLYRWIPNTEVRTSEEFWAALVVTVLWEITSAAFAWYIASGLVYYDLLYGSLTVITVHMLWFYLNSQILLFGAYLSSAIAQSSQRWVVTIPGKEESRNNAILKQDPPLRDRPQRKA